MKRVELVVPGGSLDKLKYAVNYGADAVYISGREFSLRAKSKNFSPSELNEAVVFTQNQYKKIYLALNIFAHNEHLKALENFLKEVKNIPFDAFIISDPGILALVKEIIPESTIHLSTQANTTNFKSIEFWENQGIKRIILARELTLKEIKEIRKKTAIELETFIHGAMCMAYSGRCLLSNYFTARESNLGDCSHPCRWNYSVVEEKREGQFLPIYEDTAGTEIFSSQDLCMVEYIDQLIEAGINAFKIEGRMKSIFYVSNVTRIYREAIDDYYANPQNFKYKKEWPEELKKVSHRDYSTGFFFADPQEEAQIKKSAAMKKSEFLGLVKNILPNDWCEIKVKSKIRKGETVEIISPLRKNDTQTILEEIQSKEDESLSEANPNQEVLVKTKAKIFDFAIIRK